jgi:dimethylaniline monooxygenase (N-oxide forming)
MESYAQEYKLHPFIRLRSEVQRVRRQGEGWRIAIKGVEAEFEFDRVIVCGGTHATPVAPCWPDQDKFKGEVVHSIHYKSALPFAGKRVLVVGLGESGGDIVYNIARVAQATCLSSRAGPGVVIPRHALGSVSDLDTSRGHHGLPKWFGSWRAWRLKTLLEEACGWWGRKAYTRWDTPQLDCKVEAELGRFNTVPWQNRFGTKTTSWIEACLFHNTLYKPGIQRFTEKGVVFVDGSEFECDAVVACTGFRPRFMFLEKDEPELCKLAGRPREGLFKNMFDPNLGPSIAFLGYVRPAVGSIPPVVELQARYFARLASGLTSLPPVAEMLSTIQADNARLVKQFVMDAPRIGVLVDFLPYVTDLARLIGCEPPLRRLFFTQPYLWYKVIFGPLMAAQYRLAGPGRDPRAPATILRARAYAFPVILFEAWVLILCKTLSSLGFASFATTGC